MKKILCACALIGAVYAFTCCNSKDEGPYQERHLSHIDSTYEGQYRVPVTAFWNNWSDSLNVELTWDAASFTPGDTVEIGVVYADDMLSWQYLKPGEKIDGVIIKIFWAIIRDVKEIIRPDYQ